MSEIIYASIRLMPEENESWLFLCLSDQKDRSIKLPEPLAQAIADLINPYVIEVLEAEENENDNS